MNYREPPHTLAGTRKAGLCLSLWLLASALPSAHALPASLALRVVVSRPAESTPYLPVAGAPAMRFQEPAPAPAAMPSSVSAAAPVVASSDVSSAPVSPAPLTAPSSATAEASVADKPANKESTSSPTKAPAPILPDDTRPTVRPEDFLPYFQIPGSARQPADVTLLVPVPRTAPAPASLPPSSATYTQTPK